MKTHILLPAILILSMLLFPQIRVSSADQEVEEVEEKELKMAPGGTVKISLNDGSIHVTTWDKADVSLRITRHARGENRKEAQKRLKEIDVLIEQNGHLLTIRERDRQDRSYSVFDLFDPGTWNELTGRRRWVDFDLVIPVQMSLALSTDEGDISVSGIEGDIDLETDEGRTELRNIHSDHISIVTDEGDILLKNVRAVNLHNSSRLDINTDESNVELIDVEMGRVKVESDEGDVYAENVRCYHLDSYSDEGDIEATLDILTDGDYRCRTDEGEIVLYLPDGSSFDISARSEEGRIRSAFPLDVRELADGERVDDTIGQGGADLYLYNETGDIQLRKK